jgi:hypothetical protein
MHLIKKPPATKGSDHPVVLTGPAIEEPLTSSGNCIRDESGTSPCERLQDAEKELVLQNEACGNALVDTEARLQAAEHALREIEEALGQVHGNDALGVMLGAIFACSEIARAALAAATPPGGETAT